MKALSKLISATCLSLVFCGGVQANLIHNGSFEDVSGSSPLGNYGSASTWQIYSSIPNWDASQNVEIWSNDFIVDAYHENNVLELNAHPGDPNGQFSIFQDFVTVTGQEYQLTFAGRKRQENSDESFSVSVGNLSETITNQAFGSWNEYSYSFIASSDLSTLTFTSQDGGSDTTGNIFDAVVITSVPEPSSVLLLGLGLVGLGLRRRK